MADNMDVDVIEPRGTKRTAVEADLPLEAPRRIKPLAEDVVNKIAAGEIIVAPMNALKELLENSVDAGSTAIEVLVKEGGLKLLQITDNGHGIEKEDLPILCERFTTSKLKQFEDLMSIGTYGFRGEALASISHIAHLRVATRTAKSSCAWQAHYADGKLIPSKQGESAEPKAAAGRKGTQITVEDLFYNVPNRRKAFRSPSEEYAKILDVITKYAVHCEKVAFSIKKHGESGAAFTVPEAATKLDRIKQAYSAAIGKELIPFEIDNQQWGLRASGYATNANYSSKRTVLLLFINHRSVESTAVKKAIEQTYQVFLPKGGHPFVYLSLEIDPQRVDVNVHPTKREVHFLNEDEIIELVCSSIRECLTQVDTTRTFKTQTLLTGVAPMTPLNPRTVSIDSNEMSSTADSVTPKASSTKRPYENNLIRTDSKMRKITSMLPPVLTPGQSVDDAGAEHIRYTLTDKEYMQIRLSSVKSLRAEVRDSMHNGLTEIFASLTYVGLVDSAHRLAAVQSGVKLFLVDYGMVANQFFYQVGLTDFGNFGLIRFQPPLMLRDLLTIAAKFEVDQSTGNSNMDPDIVVEKVFNQLMSRKAMLKEYFSLEITDGGEVAAIPMLLKGYMPCIAKLPTFLLRLGPFVDWKDEQKCFQTFLVELASFYVPERVECIQSSPEHETQDDAADQAATTTSDRAKEMEKLLEHVLFPAFRSRLVATTGMISGVIEVANLKGLYRVFERC